jgi:hypothetical protein
MAPSGEIASKEFPVLLETCSITRKTCALGMDERAVFD